MTKRSKESEETFKLIAPGSLFQGRNCAGDLVVGYRLPDCGKGAWLRAGWGWRLDQRPWGRVLGWSWGVMPDSERDFVVIGVYPSLEALSDDQIKALCERSLVDITAAVKVGDTIDWYTTPDNAMVRDSDGGIALRRGRHGQWRCVERAGARAWGEYVGFAWDDTMAATARKADDVVVIALDVPLDCETSKQLETRAAIVATLNAAVETKKAVTVGDRIAWDDVPHWALVHIEGDKYAVRFDARTRSKHADGWTPDHHFIDKWPGLYKTCTMVAQLEHGFKTAEAHTAIDAHKARVKVGDTVPWDKVPDNAMVRADGGCIALRRGARGRWYKNKFPNGWSTDSYIAFNWTNKDDAARADNDAEIVALDVPPDAEASVVTLKLVAGDA